MDLGIYETLNGGDLSIQQGDLWATQTLWPQIYCALFGGNPGHITSEASESEEQRGDWWGNVFLEDPDERINSQTENTLNTVALNSSGRLAVEQAVKNDLSFLQKIGTVEVSVSIEGIDRVLIEIGLIEPKRLSEQRFRILWDGTKATEVTDINADKTGGLAVNAWILRNGIWEDIGAWFDNEYWKDTL